MKTVNGAQQIRATLAKAVTAAPGEGERRRRRRAADDDTKGFAVLSPLQSALGQSSQPRGFPGAPERPPRHQGGNRDAPVRGFSDEGGGIHERGFFYCEGLKPAASSRLPAQPFPAPRRKIPQRVPLRQGWDSSAGPHGKAGSPGLAAGLQPQEHPTPAPFLPRAPPELGVRRGNGRFITLCGPFPKLSLPALPFPTHTHGSALLLRRRGGSYRE